MKRLVILAVVVALLPGCAANLGIAVGNTGKSATQPSVGPGGSFSGAGVGAQLSDVPGFAALLGAGVMSVLFGGGERRREAEPDTTRRVNEQDCRKPVDTSANLRCN